MEASIVLDPGDLYFWLNGLWVLCVRGSIVCALFGQGAQGQGDRFSGDFLDPLAHVPSELYCSPSHSAWIPRAGIIGRPKELQLSRSKKS